MRIYLLGSGISHSLSPAVWNGVFDELAPGWRYGLWDTEEDGLQAVIEELREPDLVGFNITMPYKGWGAAQAQIRDANVERAGVANWLSMRKGTISAANTDVEGARTLFRAVPPSDVVLVLGAGGTAAAVLAALEGLADHIVVTNRTYARAIELAEHASGWVRDISAIPWQRRMEVAPTAALIVNTTPLGLQEPVSPLDEMEPREDARIYDVIYSPSLTPLQLQAAEWGLELADGLAHLEAQAIALLPHFGLSQHHDDLVRAKVAAAAGRQPCRWRVPGPSAGERTA